MVEDINDEDGIRNNCVLAEENMIENRAGGIV